MATGDDATAAGMDLVGGATEANTIDSEINKTRDYIAQRTSAVTPVSKGGTGANNAADARTNLSAAAASHTHPATSITTSGGASNVQADQDFIVGQLGGKRDYTDGYFGAIPIATPYGRANAVNTSWVAAAINGDGRIGIQPSALKYKRDIEPYEGSILDIEVVTYVMKDDPLGTVRLGVIADQVNEVEPMLVVHEDGEPEGVKYELIATALLLEVQRLAARVASLESGEGL